jgi:hypothetical protein
VRGEIGEGIDSAIAQFYYQLRPARRANCGSDPGRGAESVKQNAEKNKSSITSKALLRGCANYFPAARLEEK